MTTISNDKSNLQCVKINNVTVHPQSTSAATRPCLTYQQVDFIPGNDVQSITFRNYYVAWVTIKQLQTLNLNEIKGNKIKKDQTSPEVSANVKKTVWVTVLRRKVYI